MFRRYDITAEADLLEAAEKLERFIHGESLATDGPERPANSPKIAQPADVAGGPEACRLLTYLVLEVGVEPTCPVKGAGF